MKSGSYDTGDPKERDDVHGGAAQDGTFGLNSDGTPESGCIPTRPDSASAAGIDVMHAIRKGRLMGTGNSLQTPGEQFYTLAA